MLWAIFKVHKLHIMLMRKRPTFPIEVTLTAVSLLTLLLY